MNNVDSQGRYMNPVLQKATVLFIITVTGQCSGQRLLTLSSFAKSLITQHSLQYDLHSGSFEYHTASYSHKVTFEVELCNLLSLAFQRCFEVICE